jgi:tetratricopeptide (TPR) repeat protein
MFKSQIILSVVAIALISGLYALPKSILKSDRKQTTASVTESVQTPTQQSDIAHQNAGSPEQYKELNRLRNLFAKTSGQNKVKAADSLANLYAGLQKPDSAAYFVEQIYLLNPSPENLLRTGDAYYEAWRFAAEGNKANPAGEKTRLYYEKVLAQNPKALEVKSRLAMTYSTTENPMQAIMMLREVVSEDPANQTALFYLGMLSMRSGQYEKAIERFKQVLAKHPEDTEAHLYMGISYKQTGDIAAAKKEFLFVKETEKDPAILEAAEAYLKEIQ